MDDASLLGQCQLVEKVIKPGICVTCGACVGLCPYFDYYDGKIVLMEQCRADTWRCLQLCPRADFEDTALERTAVSGARETSIGPFKSILVARSSNKKVRAKAQYGGIVSALLMYALERGDIRSAILTDRGMGISPAGTIATSTDDILGCAGSRYTASGGLAALNRAIKANEEDVAVVGVPCQMEALARMRTMEPDGKDRTDRITLYIGLFCTWALDYRKMNAYLKQLGVKAPIEKYDIPPPPSQVFQAWTEEGLTEIPLDEIRAFVQKGCTLCQDMTAHWADISVGAVEGLDGWNTVVVRSDKGSELMDAAIRDNVIETGNLPEENLNHLKEAASAKRERGIMNKAAMERKGT